MGSTTSATVGTTSHSLASRPEENTLSLPYLLAACVLIGAGLFTIFVWILSFNWPYFVGVLLLAVGALMLFSPRAGADHSR